eukprot:3674768-Amphidinium_carterae.2
MTQKHQQKVVWEPTYTSAVTKEFACAHYGFWLVTELGSGTSTVRRSSWLISGSFQLLGSLPNPWMGT